MVASSLPLSPRVDPSELTSREVLSDSAWQDDPVLVGRIVLAVQVWHPVFVNVETDCAWAVLARCWRELASAMGATDFSIYAFIAYSRFVASNAMRSAATYVN